jgi:hypothetical protein
MKYTNEGEKAKIVTAFKTFLTANGWTLRKLVQAKGLNYGTVWQGLNRGNIDSEKLDKLIKMVDEKAKLEKFNETFLITKSK